ncbi:hypothetical protein [Streptomyces sp. NPDC059943]|uniref:hypothetical protein n=1 Tax=Streptomyces sp. NPDC059943 TaxID=3347010 RepID=UPI0036461102
MAEGDPAAPYTDATRARLEMAFAAYELADLARAAVPIGEHELSPDGTTRSAGSTLADAAHVLGAARRFFEAAAVFERVGGADWQLVGDTLGVSAQAARNRFAVAEVCFREGSNGPRGEASWWRAYLADEPLEAARDLDEWVLRHGDGDSDPGPTPVSGGLVRRVRAV